MNRPLWLDLVYMGAFFAPPAIVASFVTAYFGFHGWIDAILFVLLFLLSVAAWIAGLVAWNRPSAPGADPK